MLKRIFEEITFFGGIAFYFFVLAYLLIIKEIELFSKLLVILIILYFVLVIVRSLYFKNRPEKQKYRNFLERIDASSFPSLHAGRISALFVFAILEINNLAVNLACGLLVIGVCYSRIYLKKHDLWDLTGGVFLGLIVSYLVLIL